MTDRQYWTAEQHHRAMDSMRAENDSLRDDIEHMRFQLVSVRAEVERLREALEQVLVDINDPHPRTSTLEGFRGTMRSTEAMVLRALARNNAPLVTQEAP